MNETTTPDFTLEAEQIVNGRPARSITLQEPVKRGEQLIEKLMIRKPQSGELRGVNLSDILNANTDAIMQLLPRVTVPTMVKHEVEAMDPADLLMCGMALVSFFVPKAALK
ncbi:MAG: phage tail assembly protein [Comamonas sp.]